jgi:surface antigen
LRPHRFAALAALLSAMSTAGCAYQLDTTFSKADADVEQTGSLHRPDRQATAASAVAPSETDLAYARAVAADVVAHGAKDASIPWENPNTGAGGNITPLAASYNDGALTCRDFLASYVRGQAQAWLQGEACRAGHGKWEVRSLRPFKQG